VVGSSITVPDLSLGFHIYAVSWTSTGFTFYFDGVQAGPTITTSALTLRMYILLSVWFGGASGTPTTANTPTGPANAMQIDYVRAWTIK
jgi:beta-glucanase (GH16 family)